MDEKHEFKVIKDTSARKNTMQPGMVAREVTAIKAAHEAYLSSMIAGYEEEMASLKMQHAQEIDSINTAHSQALQNTRATMQLNDTVIADKQQEAISAAIASTKAEADTKLEVSRREYRIMLKERDELGEQLTSFKARANTATKKVRAELEEAQNQSSKLKLAHKAEIDKMQSLVAIEISVKGTAGRKTRKYMKRPATTISSFIQEYCKDVGRSVGFFTWRHEGRIIVSDRHTSLLDLGIKDGDEIWATTM